MIYITFTRSTILFSYLFLLSAATNNPIFFIGLLVVDGRVVHTANRSARVRPFSNTTYKYKKFIKIYKNLGFWVQSISLTLWGHFAVWLFGVSKEQDYLAFDKKVLCMNYLLYFQLLYSESNGGTLLLLCTWFLCEQLCCLN